MISRRWLGGSQIENALRFCGKGLGCGEYLCLREVRDIDGRAKENDFRNVLFEVR